MEGITVLSEREGSEVAYYDPLDDASLTADHSVDFTAKTFGIEDGDRAILTYFRDSRRALVEVVREFGEGGSSRMLLPGDERDRLLVPTGFTLTDLSGSVASAASWFGLTSEQLVSVIFENRPEVA